MRLLTALVGSSTSTRSNCRTPASFLLISLVLGCLPGCTAKSAPQSGTTVSPAADAAMSTIRADAIRAGMRFLADDALEGRGPGTRGYDIAAKYVAAAFEADGLAPAGDGGAYDQLATPPFESAVKAHYSHLVTRAANAAAHGAVGLVILFDPVIEDQYPFALAARDFSTFPSFKWLDRQRRPNDYFERLDAVAWVSLNVTRKLFALSGHKADDVFAAAKAGRLQPFDMKVTARVRTVSTRRDVSSSNVVARLEGSDPTLKKEYVVYTAHIDHLGIGAEVRGDRIYHGALDNASGAAAMLELARVFSAMKPRPKRSLLFAAVTGEEAGLLVSDLFVHNPTVPKGSIVANVNLDEIMMLWPMRDVVLYGSEHSTLGALAQRAASHLNLAVSPDPQPEEVQFVRSDQYSFVKQGIPAVQVSVGFKSDDPKIDPRAIFKKWEMEQYHEPQDDMRQPGLLFSEAVTFAKFSWLLGYLVAQDTKRPEWNQGDFFGSRFGTRVAGAASPGK